MTIFGAVMVLASCNKDSNTDTFCAAASEKDWETVETVLKSEVDNYTNKVWQENAIELCKTMNKKDCIDTAFARLNTLGSNPQTTEIVFRYNVNDTLITRIETFYITTTTGILTVKTKFPKTN